MLKRRSNDVPIVPGGNEVEFVQIVATGTNGYGGVSAEAWFTTVIDGTLAVSLVSVTTGVSKGFSAVKGSIITTKEKTGTGIQGRCYITFNRDMPTINEVVDEAGRDKMVSYEVV